MDFEFIHNLINLYLLKDIDTISDGLLKCINGENPNYIPVHSNPNFYIISIYDPLEMYFVLIGKQNFVIESQFSETKEVEIEILKYNNLDITDLSNLLLPEIIQIKRYLEYEFLKLCLNKLEKKLERKIKLYHTQHITEISYDISKSKKIDSIHLWELLNKMKN